MAPAPAEVVAVAAVAVGVVAVAGVLPSGEVAHRDISEGEEREWGWQGSYHLFEEEGVVGAEKSRSALRGRLRLSLEEGAEEGRVAMRLEMRLVGAGVSADRSVYYLVIPFNEFQYVY